MPKMVRKFFRKTVSRLAKTASHCEEISIFTLNELLISKKKYISQKLVAYISIIVRDIFLQKSKLKN